MLMMSIKPRHGNRALFGLAVSSRHNAHPLSISILAIINFSFLAHKEHPLCLSKLDIRTNKSAQCHYRKTESKKVDITIKFI